ncbi:hypothetical protein HYH03_001827 [Edaphochlamys debaryana]|uniref:RRM domain-containing protein n=1 Tax=Edaphochlamys debaryana TaxID=47281 RepID=A0A835YEG1_9CHLO|nr:hypothetical protein HYH03_001827 [Edaphochlamys debaryana]|eukprot:KAG2500249.1 hypothetical protein HYH03_001827 [Edaphochlamys debaryana]
MSSANKKRKVKHGQDKDETGAAAAAGKPQLPQSADERFQLDSDFEDDLDDSTLLANPKAPQRAAADGSGKRAGAGREASAAAAGRKQRGPSGAAAAAAAAEAEAEADGDASGGGSEDPGSGAGLDASDDADGLAEAGPSGSGEGEDEEPGDGGAERRAGGAGASGSGSDGDGDGADGGDGGEQQRKRKKVLSKRKLAAVNEAADRRGIVFISRIPPHMKPAKLRQLLEPHGALGRVYCAPEDPTLRRLRKKKGGNSGKNFTEGWVEFEDKRRAKRAALALNGQPMGGSKRSAYYYDLWNIKYLPKFKWDSLTEEINYQRAVREQRLVAEISAAKRERDFYLSRVDKAKAIDAIKERKAKKEAQDPGSAAAAAAAAAPAAAADSKPAAGAPAGAGGAGGDRRERKDRFFGQRKVKADPVSAAAPVLSQDVLGLFGRKRG